MSCGSLVVATWEGLVVGKIARNGNVNPRAPEADVGPGDLQSITTSCLSLSFPSGANSSHSVSLRRRYVTPAARKLLPIPKKKYFVVFSTRRISAIGPALLALGGPTLVASYNAPFPLFKPTKLSNVPGFSTSVTPDGRGTLNWKESSNACARRWRSSRLWTPVHSRRRTGRRTLGREA